MREILFRGKAGNRWLYGDAHTNYKGKISTIIVPSLCWKTETIETQCAGYFGVNPETIGQYTGLTDKNGKKIFEGDILKAHHNDYPYLVSYEECRFKIEDKWGNRIKMTQNAINWFEVEVIGNIFDNPELLNDKK